jgi:hypothetical protein
MSDKNHRSKRQNGCRTIHLQTVQSIRINQVSAHGSSGMHKHRCHRIKIAVPGHPRVHSSAKQMNSSSQCSDIRHISNSTAVTVIGSSQNNLPPSGLRPMSTYNLNINKNFKSGNAIIITTISQFHTVPDNTKRSTCRSVHTLHQEQKN